MQNAIYIHNGTAEKITASQISSRTEYLTKYNGHIYCPTPGCTASLTFALTPSFMQKKIFKTAKNSEHADGCPYKILYGGSQQYRYSSESINQSLSDNHKRDVLHKLYLRNIKPESDVSQKTKPSTKKDTSSETNNSVPRTRPSISSDATPVQIGQREPSVIKRKSNDLLPEDIGQLRGIDGYATSANVGDNFVEIWIAPNLSLLFYNAFRDASKSSYEQVIKLAHDIINHKASPLICCIGNVDRTPYGYQIQIMNPSLVTFDNKHVLTYYSIA